MKRLNLVGQKFGMLTVLEYSHSNKIKSYWLCKCDCGEIKVICGVELRRGRTKSCGCLQKETASIMAAKRLGKNHPRYKHGLSNTKAYICACARKRDAAKLNQTPSDANLDIIQFYYTVASTMGDYHVDHIQPLSKGGLHHQDNLQLLDKSLNRQKYNKWPLTEEEQIKYRGYRL